MCVCTLLNANPVMERVGAYALEGKKNCVGAACSRSPTLWRGRGLRRAWRAVEACKPRLYFCDFNLLTRVVSYKL